MVSQQSTYRHLSPPRYRRQTLAVFHSPPERASADRSHRPEATAALSRKWVHRSVGDLSAGNDFSTPNPRLLSSFYLELREKYPHAFQHKLEEREATRRVFNARPQVHFDDENTFEGRKQLNLNSPGRHGSHTHLTNWDREVGHYFKSRSNMRDCMTSAESSEICAPTRAGRFNSQTLNRLLNEQSPLRRKFQMASDATRSELDIQEYFLEKSKARSKHRRKHCRILQRRIENGENDMVGENEKLETKGLKDPGYKSWNGHLKSLNGENAKDLPDTGHASRKVDVNSVVADTDLKIDTLMEQISLKMSSPESLPDSAIDIDTPSVGSFGSSARGGNPELQVSELSNLNNSAESPRGASKDSESSSNACQKGNVPKVNGHSDIANGEDISASELSEHDYITGVNKLTLAVDGHEQEEIPKDSVDSLETGLLQIYTEHMNTYNSEHSDKSKDISETVSDGDVRRDNEVLIDADRHGEADVVSESSTAESLSSGVQSIQSCVERPVFRMDASQGDDHARPTGQSMQKFHNRDSDVDSGIGQSSSGTDIVHRGRSRGRTPNINQMKVNEGFLPLRSEVDCCILDEVDLMNSVHQVSNQRDDLNEEDDTADTRTEIAKVTPEEIKIAEKYRRTRSPSPYILSTTRIPSHVRPNSAPYFVKGGHSFQIVDISISDKRESELTKANKIQNINSKTSSCQRQDVTVPSAKCHEDSIERNGTKRRESEGVSADLVDLIPGKNRPRCSVSSLSSSGTASSHPENFDNVAADLPGDFDDIEDNDEIYEAGANGNTSENAVDHVNNYARNGAAVKRDSDETESYKSKGNYDTSVEPKVTGHGRRYKPGVASPRVNEKRQKLRNKMKSKSESSVQNYYNEAQAAQRIYAKERLTEERDHRLPTDHESNGVNAMGQIGRDENYGANDLDEANAIFRAKSDTDIGNSNIRKGSNTKQSKGLVGISNDNTPDALGVDDVRVGAEVYQVKPDDRLSAETGSVESVNNGNRRSPDADTQHRAPPVKPARTKRKKTLPADFNLSNYKIKPNEGQPSSAVGSGGSSRVKSENDRSIKAREQTEVDVIEKLDSAPPGGRHPVKGTQLQTEMAKDGTDAQPAHKSNLEKSKKLSASKVSLLDKMGTLKTATKGKIKKLRKAVSLERGIDKCSIDPNPDPHRSHDAKGGHSGQPKMKKAPSLKSLTSFFGKLKKKKGKWSAEDMDTESGPVPSTSSNRSGHLSAAKRQQWTSCQGLSALGPGPVNTAPVGKLLEMSPDGTQVVQLFKPSAGPMGFFIARGSDKYQKGIFVSRLSENRTENCFAGLLGVGDEILTVNGHFVRDLSQDAVYSLISASPVVVLKVLPLIARKDV